MTQLRVADERKGAPRRSGPLKINFTKQAIERLRRPAEGREYTYDTRTAGLCVCVTRMGTRTFYLYRRIRNRPQRVRIGLFPETSIEQARRLAVSIAARINDGADPNAERREVREETILSEAFAVYLETEAKPHLRSWREYERSFDLYLKGLHSRPLSSITTDDVRAVHVRIREKHGRYMANRSLSLLTRIYNWANKPNPCKGVRRFDEVERERYLDAGELHRFLQAVEGEPDPTIRDFFKVLLFTGQRRGNVQRMRWEHLNLDSRVWRIPGEEFKNKKPHAAPLTAPVMDILRRRQRESQGRPFVFWSYGVTGHILDPRTAWKCLLERAGLTDLRMHDLRRTFGSWQAAIGTSSLIIGKSLGHRDQATTAIYARLNLDPVRDSVERATEAMLAAKSQTFTVTLAPLDGEEGAP